MRLTKEEALNKNYTHVSGNVWERLKNGVMTTMEVMSDHESKSLEKLIETKDKIEGIISWSNDKTLISDLEKVKAELETAIDYLRN